MRDSMTEDQRRRHTFDKTMFALSNQAYSNAKKYGLEKEAKLIEEEQRRLN